MLWLSSLLVFGSLGWFVLAAAGTGLPPGHEQWIHARVPWIVLGLLWVGASLGVAALAQKRGRLRWLALGLQVPVVAFLSVYFLQLSFLPDRSIALEVGDSFPGYALTDHDGQAQSLESGSPREPALYIFYRGDW